MIRSAMLALVVLGAVAAAGCDSANDNPSGPAPGPGGSDRPDLPGPVTPPDGQVRYAYAAYDGDGVAVVTGEMVLTFEHDRVVGTWQLEATGSGDVGPQVGQGELLGFLDESGGLFVNLNPLVADDNVFLAGWFGDVGGSVLGGEWNWSGFPGVITSGTFTAHRF